VTISHTVTYGKAKRRKLLRQQREQDRDRRLHAACWTNRG
jgi:hypothetical protein